MDKKAPWLKKFLAEFFVIFLSVYLAFLFTDYQESLQDREVLIKYYDGLVFEFQVLSQHLDQEHEKITTHISVVEAIEAGKQPDLPAPDLYYLYHSMMIQAAFNANNYRALDISTRNSIIGGTIILEQLEQKTTRLQENTRTLLLPELAKENPTFYDPQGNLLPKFAWYPTLIRDIQATNRDLHEEVTERAIPQMTEAKIALEKKWF